MSGPDPVSTPVSTGGVLWWSLDRWGDILPANPAREADAPPLKNKSPYTPNFLVDGELPAAHLHHRDGQIIGIHGEADLAHLKLTLALCLMNEAKIIQVLAPKHHFDIMLSDVLALLAP